MSYINSKNLRLSAICEFEAEFECLNIGTLASSEPNTFSFLDDEKYLGTAINNENITVLLVPKYFEYSLKGKLLIKVDDPKKTFYIFFNYLLQFKEKKSKKIASSAIISKTALLADYNVSIGERTYIGDNVIIKEDVYIGNDVTIGSGTIIGGEGLEFKRIDGKGLKVVHDKSVQISNNVSVGSNCVIDKGVYRDTVICSDTQIDSLVHIAHASQIKENVMIGSGSIILGSVSIGNNVWVGPNSTISSGVNIGSGAYIVLGSVVIENVESNSKISGNFAKNHLLNLIKYKK
jgi:UDP-3-O-[3-hydroxymyristoyl] glucosamine N-acyltransferase